MFILAVFDSLYNGSVYHVYLNALYIAKKNNWGIITNKKHVDAGLNYKDIYFNTFPMEKVSEKDMDTIPILSIEDEIFEKDYRTQTLMSLYTERNSDLEKIIEAFLDNIEKTTKVEGIIFWGESYLSLRYLAQNRGLMLIPYDFSTIRMVDGFSLNLLIANKEGQLYENDECYRRYVKFRKEVEGAKELKEYLFTRKELIALFERDYALPCIPLIEQEGNIEISVIGTGGRIIPFFFNYEDYTDDDLMADCRKAYLPEQIKFRDHPAYMDTNSVQFANTPRTPFLQILSSKRIAAICSNTLFEAMLWNRAVFSKNKIMPFSFMCNGDCSSKDKVDEVFLNFYLLCYLVPGFDCLFSQEYWTLRKNAFSESEIFKEHIRIICHTLGIREDMLNLSHDERWKELSEKRLDRIQYNSLMANLNYQVITSGLKINDEKAYHTLNSYDSETMLVTSEFTVKTPVSGKCFFEPLVKRAGVIRIKEISIDDEMVNIPDDYIYAYMEYSYAFMVHNAKTIKIRWEYYELSLDTINKLAFETKNLRNFYENKLQEVKRNRNIILRLKNKITKWNKGEICQKTR